MLLTKLCLSYFDNILYNVIKNGVIELLWYNINVFKNGVFELLVYIILMLLKIVCLCFYHIILIWFCVGLKLGESVMKFGLQFG